MRLSRLEKFRREVGGAIDKGLRDSGTDRAYIDAMGLQLNITMGSMKDEGKRHR